MSITPVLLGDNKATVTTSPLTVTTGSAVPANGYIAVFTGYQNNGGNTTVSGVTDNGGTGNTYSKAVSKADGSGGTAGNGDWWVCQSSGGLASGKVITITYANGTTNYNWAAAVYVPGLTTSSSLDVAPGVSTSTASVSETVPASGSFSQTSEVVLYGVTQFNAGNTLNSFTAPITSLLLNYGQASQVFGGIGYDVTSATTAISAAATFSGAAAGMGAALVLKTPTQSASVVGAGAMQANNTQGAIASATGASVVGAQMVLHQGIIFRYSNDSNYWLADRDGVWKRVSGTLSLVGEHSARFENNDRMTVVLLGSLIKVYMNGNTLVNTITDSFNSTATLHGLVVE